VLLSMSHTRQAFCCSAKTKEYSRLSRFGMTYEHLTDNRGEALLTWYLAGFRVRTSAQPEQVPESTESAAGSGERWQESFAWYDRASSSWKTPQCSLLGGYTEFSETWPKWGTMRNGVCLERTMPERRTSENGYGFWPTPTVNGNYNQAGMSAKSGDGLATAVKKRPTPRSTDGTHGGRVTPRKSRNGGNLIEAVSKEMSPTPNQRDWKDSGPTQGNRKSPNLGTVCGGQLNPTWVEWLMGWPLGWTDLKPLETDKYRQWLLSHGSFFADKRSARPMLRSHRAPRRDTAEAAKTAANRCSMQLLRNSTHAP
jgi:hypothetical protein